MQIKTNPSQKELKTHGNFQFPFLVSYERLSNYESGSFLFHWHPEIELTYIKKGEMLYQVQHKTFHLKEGDAFFCNQNALHSGHMYEQNECEYDSITFDSKIIYGYENSLIYTKYVAPILFDLSIPCMHLTSDNDWKTKEINKIKSIINLSQMHESGYELQINATLLEFWKTLFEHKNSTIPLSISNQKNDERIKTILQYISYNYSKKITLFDIANEVFLCTSECSRLFKRHMHISLFDYLLQYRIEMSLALLVDRSLTLLEVAQKSGFNDSNYYSKTFHKKKGCSPKEYRNSIFVKE